MVDFKGGRELVFPSRRVGGAAWFGAHRLILTYTLRYYSGEAQEREAREEAEANQVRRRH